MNDAQMAAFYPLTLSVRRLFHRLGGAAAALHRDHDVTIGMRAVLESLIDGGPQTVPRMARVRPVSRQHMQTLVNALLERGYVDYVDNPAHKRSKLVSVTAHGRAVFDDMRRIENEAFARADIPVSAEDLEAATRVLRTLIRSFGSAEWHATVRQLAPTEKEDAA